MISLKLPFIVAIGLLVGTYALAEPETDNTQFMFQFTNYLEQLREPDLKKSCSKEVQTIRLIANPAFSDAWSVRVERSSNLVSVHTSEANTLSTPTLSNQTVDESIWTGLEQILDAEEIGGIPKTIDTWIPDDTIATIETCLGGRYDAIQRQFWHPETKKLVSHLELLRSTD